MEELSRRGQHRSIRMCSCSFLLLVVFTTAIIESAGGLGKVQVEDNELVQSCAAGGREEVVKKLSSLEVSNYGRPGLAHMTVAGAVHHGMREVEVWIQTFAPGSGTPIHRHACEEVFLVLRGSGVLRMASGHPKDSELPGSVAEHTYTMNDTFTVPFDAVHQVRNVGLSGDLQLLVVISRPPIRVYVYDSWTTPHADARLAFPYPWDARCPLTTDPAAATATHGSISDAGWEKAPSVFGTWGSNEALGTLSLESESSTPEWSVVKSSRGRFVVTPFTIPVADPQRRKDVKLFHSAVVAQQEVERSGVEAARLESIALLKHEGQCIARGGDAEKRLPMQTDERGGIHNKVIDELLRPRGWGPPKGGRFFLEAEQIIELCDSAEHILSGEPTVVRIHAPVKIFGDLHGQFFDLLRWFDLYGMPSVAGDILYVDYLFLGDYVDRGDYSLETITLLLALKIMHPGSIHLLRGNHETASVNSLGGFLSECIDRLGYKKGVAVHDRFNDLFRWLPLAAVVDGSIFCVHGGIGGSIGTIDEIEAVQRPIADARASNTVQELLWSDPTKDDSVLGLHKNKRGEGITAFGPDRVEEFCRRNGLQLIVRAHEQVMDGFRRFAGGRLFTVFSAPKYTGRGKNAGAILVIGRDHLVIPKLLRPLSWEGNGANGAR